VAEGVELSGAPGLAVLHLDTGVVLRARVGEGELAAASDDRADIISPTLTIRDREGR